MEDSKKPWRTLVSDGREQAGRLTRTQIREAVRKVKAEREARETRARKRAETAARPAAESVNRSGLDERGRTS